MSLRLPHRSRLIKFTLILSILGILATFYIKPRQIVHEDGFYPVCPNNLKQLAIALHNYHDTYGSFPPPYVVDIDGRPIHSWRILILPSLGESELYDQYDFNEPWNGPHNSMLADQMPTVFGCPDQQVWEWHAGVRRWKSSMTNYVALVGANAAFKPDTHRNLSDFKGGTADTLMLVEIGDSDINWMEPRDCNLDKTALVVAKVAHKMEKALSGEHGVHAMNVDGSIRFLPANTSPATISGLVSIDHKQ